MSGDERPGTARPFGRETLPAVRSAQDESASLPDSSVHSPYFDAYGLAQAAPEKSLGDHLDAVLRRIYLVVFVFILVVGGAVAYTFTRTPAYESRAVIQVVQVIKRAGYAVGYQRFSHPSSYMHTQMTLMKSTPVIREFVESVGVENLTRTTNPAPGSRPASAEKASTAGDRSAIGAETDEQRFVTDFADRLIPEKLSDGTKYGSNMLVLRLEGEDPGLTQRQLKAYIDFFLNRNLRIIRNEIDDARNGLREQLVMAEKKLNKSEADLIAFVNEHGLVSKDDVGLNRVMEVLNQSLDGIRKSRESQREIAALAKQGAPLVGEGVQDKKDDEYIARVKRDIAELESEYSEMVALYSPQYPKAAHLKKRIDMLKEKLAAMMKKAAAEVLKTAKTKEKVLLETARRSKEEVARINAIETEYALLKKRVDSDKTSYDSILKALNEAHIKWGAAVNNMKIVEPPDRPTSPVRPNYVVNMVWGVLFGLSLGVASALIAENLSRRVQGPRDIASRAGGRTLGAAPDLAKVKIPSAAERAGRPIEFLAHDFPKTPIADSISNIYASLLFSNPDADLRVFAVSSASPGEGKTFISVSLATILCAGSPSKTLLLDGDLRRPRLYRVFGKDLSDPGLSTALEDESFDWRRAVNEHSIDGLYYVTSGPIPENPVHLLRLSRFSKILDEMKKEFDHIVIDCPPTLGFPDVPLMARYTDGVILVAKQRTVTHDELEHAVQIVGSVGRSRFLGIVLNKVPTGRSGSGYGYSYGSYYYNSYHDYYDRPRRV